MLPRVLMVICLLVVSMTPSAAVEQRTIVVREHATGHLLNGELTFKVLKIRGYSIVIRVSGKDRVLKIGQSFSQASADCSVIFEEIATETRLARFKTDCP